MEPKFVFFTELPFVCSKEAVLVSFDPDTDLTEEFLNEYAWDILTERVSSEIGDDEDWDEYVERCSCWYEKYDSEKHDCLL